jgi:hypothetical protein
MKQSKLDNYFKIIPNYDEKNKRCFIYDPLNYKAYFDTKPEPTDLFILSKPNFKLFYRKPNQNNIKQIDIPTINCKYSIPLLKSNLQKAIRRSDNQIAIQSALAIIQIAPMEFLRRLPIIYIEDVCLMDSYSIVVWLMIADKAYGPLSNTDIDILLNIVNSLCNCKTYFPYVNNEVNYNFTHDTLQFVPNSSQLLSIHYRSEYGGLKGDMQMLKVAIDYYRMNPTKMEKTIYEQINYLKIERNIEILVEAIDFHPYPYMLSILSKLTFIDKETIKTFIWHVESGYNIRKLDTQVLSKEYIEKPTWIKIEKYLEQVRCDLIK